MKYNRIHIGEIIRDKVSELGISKQKFGQMINIQRQNVVKTVFEKNSLDADLLIRISETLDFDFFQYYRQKDECNTEYYMIKPEIKGKIILEFGKEKKEQVFKFEFGENNIEILNK